MSGARWAGVALVVAGVAAGTAIDRPAAVTPRLAGGYYVIAADFHVHSFPGDGALPPAELAREAARRGLQAIVVSNHNRTGLIEALSFIPARADVLLIPSQEVTTPAFHLVAAGIRDTIDWRLPEAELVRAIHAQGGVAIAAHPVVRSWKGSDAVLSLLDGAEVAHPMTAVSPSAGDELIDFYARARAVNPDIAPIGSSDFHMVAPLGACRTYVFAESFTIDGVLDAVRAGRTVAQDQDGVLYGAPSLTLLLDQAVAAADAPPTPRRALLTAGAVLLGLLALITVA